MAEDEMPTGLTRKNFFNLAMLLALIGVLLASYATYHHIQLKLQGHTDAICNLNATINCDKVASSIYSEVFGIPLGVWGIGYFLGLLVMAGSGAMGHKSARENLPAYIILVFAGIAAAAVLAYLSFVKLSAGCPTCMGVYAVCAGQAVLVLAGKKHWPQRADFELKNLTNGFLTGVTVVALAAVAYNFLGPKAELPRHLQDTPGKTDGAQQPAMFAPGSANIVLNKSAYSGLGEDYRRGSDSAKVVIVEFADFQCPACGSMAQTLDDVYQSMSKNILQVYKNYPLNNECNPSVQSQMHPAACALAIMGRCAGQYGKFWEYSHLAFSQQASATKESAEAWAKEVGLTDAQIKVCKESKDILDKIKDDVDAGNKAGLEGTPTLYMNGRKYTGGRDAASIKEAIQSLM